MTVYYCQSLGDNGVPETYHNEFHQFLFKVKPDADLTAYVEKIMETKEIIAGAESVREELNRNVSSPPTVAERKHLRREFKLGRVSYSETPLGACLTRRKCTKRSVMQLTACIGCDSSVTIMSKLDQAIISQTKFLENAPRNDKDDFIYRSENNELQGLRKLKRRLMRENKDGL